MKLQSTGGQGSERAQMLARCSKRTYSKRTITVFALLRLSAVHGIQSRLTKIELEAKRSLSRGRGCKGSLWMSFRGMATRAFPFRNDRSFDSIPFPQILFSSFEIFTLSVLFLTLSLQATSPPRCSMSRRKIVNVITPRDSSCFDSVY